MALNKFMHPRNIYRTPPDFERLSKLHPDFSRIAKMDASGKVTIDFKDPHSLRVLTKCLLKCDFKLDVEIPEDRLVPTLPLRLNYILWIEDLMTAIQRNSQIRGIDIGTGACAIYPLLAAVKNKWYMLGTETDPISLQKAQENIQRNNLQDMIEVRNNIGKLLIENLFREDTNDKYDFCMCNPPFYSSLQELYESRSPARLPPKNGFTGSPQELITEGGELKFCRTLLAESKNCKDQVLVFTTMVGHKCNLQELLLDLKAEGIKHTHTEFCQGRVTRWGLAWTYQNHDIYELVPPRDKPRKKNAPLTCQLPPIPNCEYNIETTYSKIKSILSGLQIEQKILNKRGDHISLDITAKENTWSNQRRKRRLLKQIKTANAKKLKIDEATNVEPSVSISDNTDLSLLKSNADRLTIEKIKIKTKITVADDHICESNNIESGDISSEKINDANKFNSLKSDNDQDIVDKVKPLEEATVAETSRIISGNVKPSQKSAMNISESKLQNDMSAEPLIHAFMKLCRKNEMIQLEIELLDGTGGKESVYQVIQYIKNNWK